MRFVRFLLFSVVLLLSSHICFSHVGGIPQTEVVSLLGQILTVVETASERQDEISIELEEALNEQRNIPEAQKIISSTLSTVVRERLPDIEARVKSQQSSFDAYVAREEHDPALMLGTMIVALLLSVFSLVT